LDGILQSADELTTKKEEWFTEEYLDNHCLRHYYYWKEYKEVYDLMDKVEVFGYSLGKIRKRKKEICSNYFNACIQGWCTPYHLEKEKVFLFTQAETQAIAFYVTDLKNTLYNTGNLFVNKNLQSCSIEALTTLQKHHLIHIQDQKIYLQFVWSLLEKIQKAPGKLVHTRPEPCHRILDASTLSRKVELDPKVKVVEVQNASMLDLPLFLQLKEAVEILYLEGNELFLFRRGNPMRWGNAASLAKNCCGLPFKFPIQQPLTTLSTFSIPNHRVCLTYKMKSPGAPGALNEARMQELIPVLNCFQKHRILQVVSLDRTHPKYFPFKGVIQKIETKVFYKVLKCTDQMEVGKRNVIHTEPLSPLKKGATIRLLEVKECFTKKKFELRLDKWGIEEYVDGTVTKDFFCPRKYCLLLWNKRMTTRHLQTIWSQITQMLLIIRF